MNQKGKQVTSIPQSESVAKAPFPQKFKLSLYISFVVEILVVVSSLVFMGLSAWRAVSKSALVSGEITVATDKKEYVLGDSIRITVKNGTNHKVCFDPNYPYIFETRVDNEWQSPSIMSPRNHTIKECLNPGKSRNFIEKSHSTKEAIKSAPSLYRAVFSLCTECTIGEEFRLSKTIYSNKFKVKAERDSREIICDWCGKACVEYPVGKEDCEIANGLFIEGCACPEIAPPLGYGCEQQGGKCAQCLKVGQVLPVNPNSPEGFKQMTGLVTVCCRGSDSILVAERYDDDCNLIPPPPGVQGGGLVCSDCGNGICEDWESVCNCPDDCSLSQGENYLGKTGATLDLLLSFKESGKIPPDEWEEILKKDTVNVSIKFAHGLTTAEIKSTEKPGIKFTRVDGQIAHSGTIYGAKVAWDKIDDLARMPIVLRIESAWQPGMESPENWN